MGAYGAPFTLKRCQSHVDKSTQVCTIICVAGSTEEIRTHTWGILSPLPASSWATVPYNYFVLFCCAYIIPQLPSFVNTLMQSFTIRLQSTTKPQTNRKRRTVQSFFSTVYILYHNYFVLSIRRTTNVMRNYTHHRVHIAQHQTSTRTIRSLTDATNSLILL